jgi:hypothetical protein
MGQLFSEAVPAFLEMVKSFRPMDISSKPVIKVIET